jgi:hypothetical protein
VLHVVNLITNAAFGVVASTATVMTPISISDIAFASITPDAEQDLTAIVSAKTLDSTTAAPTFGGMLSSSPTSLYVSQLTPRQIVTNSRNTVRDYWFTYIDTNPPNFSALISSYNTINAPTRTAANTIVGSNPNIQGLAATRTAMFNALDQVYVSAPNGNENSCRIRINALKNQMNTFLAYPFP